MAASLFLLNFYYQLINSCNKKCLIKVAEKNKVLIKERTKVGKSVNGFLRKYIKSIMYFKSRGGIKKGQQGILDFLGNCPNILF